MNNIQHSILIVKMAQYKETMSMRNKWQAAIFWLQKMFHQIQFIWKFFRIVLYMFLGTKPVLTWDDQEMSHRIHYVAFNPQTIKI